MRIKKGFTLAEILIVLMVIGVIATMTVPSLMKGVNEATYKTAFKKAYNAVTNIAAVEKVSGQLPNKADATGALLFFASLNSNLSIKEFSTAATSDELSDSTAQSLVTSDDLYLAAEVSDGNKTNKFGDQSTDKTLTKTSISESQPSPWIVTDDGIAYAVIVPDKGSCDNKAKIMSANSAKDAAKASCLVVLVDVNGLAKAPNKFESQVINGVSSNAKMNQFEGDRYYIYIGNDGVSAGPKSVTVSGRLLSDLK